MRKRVASAGGKVCAGNGSDARAVQRKISKLRRALGSDEYCSRKFAKTYGVSYTVWKREFSSDETHADA